MNGLLAELTTLGPRPGGVLATALIGIAGGGGRGFRRGISYLELLGLTEV
jgi:hypothetical protein